MAMHRTAGLEDLMTLAASWAAHPLLLLDIESTQLVVSVDSCARLLNRKGCFALDARIFCFGRLFGHQFRLLVGGGVFGPHS